MIENFHSNILAMENQQGRMNDVIEVKKEMYLRITKNTQREKTVNQFMVGSFFRHVSFLFYVFL